MNICTKCKYCWYGHLRHSSKDDLKTSCYCSVEGCTRSEITSIAYTKTCPLSGKSFYQNEDEHTLYKYYDQFIVERIAYNHDGNCSWFEVKTKKSFLQKIKHFFSE